MRDRPRRFRRLAPSLLVLLAVGCAASRPPTRAGASPPAIPAGAIPLPPDPAPSGVLFRVGLKSDLSRFEFGPPGAPWLVVSEGRAERLRSPLLFAPEAGPSIRFAVQAGAFSVEESARALGSRLSAQYALPASVAFSAERGVYRVLLGEFPGRPEAEALLAKLSAEGKDGFVTQGPAAAPSSLVLTDEAGSVRRLRAPVDLYPSAGEPRVPLPPATYRGSLRIAVNGRGTLNVVNRVDLEEYLYGVVPAEMGPKRFDEPEGLKAQAVAARTYALAHRGQFEAEGYDLCATPKCQVYSGAGVEDPATNAAVDATRGLVLASGGRFADALFVSTCGGRTENVENVFGETAVPYLTSVDCGELATTRIAGASGSRREVSRPRTPLEWRGYVLARHAPERRASRAALLETAQRWAGVPLKGRPPSSLAPSAVYPSVVAAFGLETARSTHLLPRDVAYYSEPPSAEAALPPGARDAFGFLVRFRFVAGETLPLPVRSLTEEEYGGLLVSGALRLQGVIEGSGRFVAREGSNLWVKSAAGRVGLPADPDMPLARRIGESFLAARELHLRAGDRLRWWKRGTEYLALWVEREAVGPSFERDSAWSEWVRRVSGRELARRMAGRIAGEEVQAVEVLRRSSAGRAVEIRVRTDAAEATFRRFDLRQALELPEMLFTVERVAGPQGETEFVFLGRGWGHGVGLCQNGAFGMALAGATYDAILRHYYRGIEIVPAASVTPTAPSTR